MNIDQKIAKIDMFFGHRVGLDFGGVLGMFLEAQNIDFGSFLKQKSKAKWHDVLEGPKKPSRRGKKQFPKPWRSSARDQGGIPGEQAACRGGRGGILLITRTGYPTRRWPMARRIGGGFAPHVSTW